jgi:hypothetical protein
MRFSKTNCRDVEPGRRSDLMRGFYVIWVDSAEEAYAEIAMAEDFAAVYGAIMSMRRCACVA